MDCDDLAKVAAELALGVLTGRERARAIMHLDGCGACREHIRRLALTEEDLLGLLPGRGPPAGFETGVTGRLGFTGRHRRQPPQPPRWMLAAAAAAVIAVIAVAAGLGGWGLRAAAARTTAGSSPARPTLQAATLTTASHQPVGQVFLYTRRPGWLYLTVDIGAGNGTLICQLEGRDGRRITVGSFRLTGGYGHWGGPEPLPRAAVTGARLTAAGGTALATASFPPELTGRAAGTPGTWPGAEAQSMLPGAAAVTAAVAPALTRPDRQRKGDAMR